MKKMSHLSFQLTLLEFWFQHDSKYIKIQSGVKTFTTQVVNAPSVDELSHDQVVQSQPPRPGHAGE